MSPAPAALPEALTKVPPLENGDRLTRTEFERRSTPDQGLPEDAASGTICSTASSKT
jgi:hypothetical protein